MRIVVLISALLALCTIARSQATLFSTDFEGGNSFTSSGSTSPNDWIVSTCAGNGITLPGSQSLYLSQGGPTPADCGATGAIQYSFANSPSGILETFVSTTIDATCASAIQVNFDYTITSTFGEDFAELVYSTDGGTNWIPVGSPLTNSGTWINTNIALPALLDFSSFLLGFKYTFNDANNAGFPLAVDNITVSGTDTQVPLMTCSAIGTLSTNEFCQAIVDDYSKYIITLSDNCTDSADISFIYNPIPGTVISGNPGDFFTVDLVAVDESGNQSNACSISIEIIDNDLPVFTQCQGDTVLYVDNNCETVVPDFVPFVTVTDNCSSTFTFTQTPPAGTQLSGTAVQAVSLEVFDEAGLSATCNFNITPTDTITSTITCPANQQAIVNGTCQNVLADYTSLAVTADNCGTSFTVSQSPVPGTTISSDQLITFTLNGGFPSTTKQCTFTVELIDTTAPSITCPSGPTEYVNSSCDFVLPDYSAGILWSDNCESTISNMTVSQSPVPTTPIQSNTTVTIMMTDPSGNSNSCNLLVTVLDTISPTIVCPNDTTHPTDLNCQAPMRNYVPLASGTDNCTASGSLIYSQTPVPVTQFSLPTLVTIVVEDASGNQNSCQFTVTPIDTTAPTLTCPPTVQFSTNNGCSYLLADESAIVTVDDNCTSSTNLILTQTPAAGVLIPAGTSQITFEYEDESGNSSSCNVAVTVIDDVNPVITLCPPSISIVADANCSATLGDYVGDLTATDNCTSVGNLTISQSPIPGTVISASQMVTMTVTDEEGNTEQCAFTASISDTTSPVVTCPSDIQLAINSNCEYVTPDFGPDVTGIDNCSSLANMTISQNPLAGTTQNGITAVLITLTDEQGNSSQCTTTITPIDNQAPQITCPTPAPIDNGTACDLVLPYYGTSAPVIDNCSNFTITQNPAQGTIVQTGTTQITLTVTDAGGNQANCTFSLEVNENQAPTITCPTNISSCDPIVTYVDPTFNDNCFAFLTQTDATGLSSGDAFPIGITSLEYTVSDSSGNTASCTFNVEVLEYPNANIALDTIALCGVNSAFLQADPANGEWTVLSGSGSFNNQFANETGVNNLPFGTSEFIWTVATASCGTESDTITVINSMAPSPANVQDTFIACGMTEANLFTATPSSGTGMWTTLQGGTIVNPTSPVTTVTNLTSGWNDLIWTVSSPGCPSNSDTLRILSSGNVQINQADTAICFDDFEPFTLNGTPLGSGQIGNWSFELGGGTFSSTNSSSTTVNSVELGENTIVYSIEYEECPEDSYTLTVIANYCDEFDPIFPTVITPNGDGKNDVFEVQNLEKIYPNCHIVIYNRWGSVVFESTGYADPWNGRYKGEPLPMGTYFFKLELNDEENRIFNGPISIIH